MSYSRKDKLREHTLKKHGASASEQMEENRACTEKETLAGKKRRLTLTTVEEELNSKEIVR